MSFQNGYWEDCSTQALVHGLYVLAIPQTLVIVEANKSRRIIDRDIDNLEALSEFVFHEVRSALVALVGVFVEDGGVVLLGVLAAFEHQLDQGVELGVGVLRVIHVVRGLAEISVCCVSNTESAYHTQFPFFNIIRAKQCAPAAVKLGGLPRKRSSMIVISKKYFARVLVSRS